MKTFKIFVNAAKRFHSAELIEIGEVKAENKAAALRIAEATLRDEGERRKFHVA